MNKLLLVFLLTSSQFLHAQARIITGGPNGLEVSCNDMEQFEVSPAGYRPDSWVLGVKLSDWTPDTVLFLKRVAHTCRNGVMTPRLESILAKIDEVAKIPEKERLAAQKKAIDEENKSKFSECENSKEYALFNAEDSVIQGLQNLKDDQDRIAQERRVALASGVRSLSNDYRNGAALVSDKDALKAAWTEYKQLGGKAGSPQKVKHKSADPCLALRSQD